MSRYLNVGIVQMPVSERTRENLECFSGTVEAMMRCFHRPELVVGVEGGVGLFEPESIPGEAAEFLGTLARQYGIYLVAGTMAESSAELRPAATEPSDFEALQRETGVGAIGTARR